MHYFDQIAGDYDLLRGREILNQVLETVSSAAGKDDLVVDLATGTGLFSVPLASAGHRVLGVDANVNMLKRAREKAGARTLPFNAVMSVAERLPFADRGISVMLSTNAIHHFQLRQHFREVQRVLKPGGRYVIFTRFREQNNRSLWGQFFPGFAQKETRLYTAQDFERVDREFAQLCLEEIEELSFTKPFDPKRILQTAAMRKYSTFALYSDQEFEQALSEFKNRIALWTGPEYQAEIGRLVFRHN